MTPGVAYLVAGLLAVTALGSAAVGPAQTPSVVRKPVPGPTVVVPGPTTTTPGPTVTVPGPTVMIPGPIGPSGPTGPTGSTGPAGMVCPPGYAAGPFRVNTPGGQRVLWVCMRSVG